MTQQIINTGTGPDSYTGDTLRTAFTKVNDNFSQLYAGNVGGNITVANVTASGNVTADYFFGDGSNLTGIVATSSYGNTNVAAYLPTYSGNVNAAYFTGNGALLTGISATANLGNLLVTGSTGQTLAGTVPGSLFISPYAGNSAVIQTEFDSTGIKTNLVISSISNAGIAVSTGVNSLGATPNLVMASGSASIRMIANTGSIGFNGTPGGYTYSFYNGSLYSREFYAESNFPTGYQFNTPGGDTGLSHEFVGNVSLLRIRHDSAEVAKFYDNLTTVLSGNLVVSQTGNVFGTFPNAYVQTYSNIDSYSQLVLQNINSGSQASFDVILTADNGNDSAYFGDFGVASSTYNYPGYGIIKPNDVYLMSVGTDIVGPGSAGKANLIVGSTNGNIKMFVGAPEDANLVATFSNSGLTLSSNMSLRFGDSTTQTTAWLGNVDAVNAHINFSSSAVGHNPGNGTITFADGTLQSTAYPGATPWTQLESLSVDFSASPNPTTITLGNTIATLKSSYSELYLSTIRNGIEFSAVRPTITIIAGSMQTLGAEDSYVSFPDLSANVILRNSYGSGVVNFSIYGK